eukprot:jgi/Astpho2/4369/Aster-08066
MAKSKSAATGKGANRWPKIQQKRGLAAEELHGQDIMQASSATPAEQTAQVLLSKPPSLFLIHAQVQGCLSVAEAARFVETAARIGFQHQSSRGAAYGEAFRDNERISVQDEALAQQLWSCTGLQEVFADVDLEGWQAVGLNPNIRVYKYCKGQRFGKHVDDSVDLPAPGRRTLFTLLIYLTVDHHLRGGETIFWSSGRKPRAVACVAPVAGMALLHRHGEECLEHEGAAVTEGLKYVLRSDVCFERTQA